MKRKKETKATPATSDLAKRHERHIEKRAGAMASLAAKVAAIGDDALLDEYEAAALVGKSVQWLRNRRIYGGSLPFLKIGAGVRYRLGDVKSALTVAA